MKIKKRKNPVIIQDYTFLKILRRIVLTVFLFYDILFICMLVRAIVLHITGMLSTNYPAPLWLKFLGLPVLLFLGWVFSWALIPRYWNSMQAMKGCLRYRQLKKLLANEELTNTPLSSLSQSQNWLKVMEIFVPKNFVLGTFAFATNAQIVSNYHVMLVLLNGNMVRYTVGYKEKIDPAVHELEKLLPKADTSGYIENWIYSKGMCKKLKADYMTYTSKHPIEPLVDTWSDYADACMNTYHVWREDFAAEIKDRWKNQWKE